MEYFFGNPDESDTLFLYDVTKKVLHSSLRKYYFELLAQYKVYKDHYKDAPIEFLSVFGECERLLREVFGDEIVKDGKYNDLPF